MQISARDQLPSPSIELCCPFAFFAAYAYLLIFCTGYTLL